MKAIIVGLGLGLAITGQALALPGNGCCFQLVATGGPDGAVGQIEDGQIRIGQGLPQSTFCISGSSIVDQSKKGCLITSPETQWQCDHGREPLSGFAIDCHGTLSYSGNSIFWTCPTGDRNGWNIYIRGPPGQQKCVPVRLSSTSGKYNAKCPPSIAPTVTSMAPTITSKAPTVTSMAPTATSQASLTTGCSKPAITVTNTFQSTVTVPTNKCQSPFQSGCGRSSTWAHNMTMTNTRTQVMTNSSTPTSMQCQCPPRTCKWPNYYPCSGPCRCSTDVAKPTASLSMEASKHSCPHAQKAKPCFGVPSNNWQHPQLIVPVDKSHPDKEFGPQLSGTLSENITSIFNFVIPQSLNGKKCQVIFYVPHPDRLKMSGGHTYFDGVELSITPLQRPVGKDTTYGNKPDSIVKPQCSSTIQPGSAVVLLELVSCPGGSKLAYELSVSGGRETKRLITWLQDSKGELAGLYMASCSSKQ